MNPKNGVSVSILARHQEDGDFEKWLNAGGRERINALKARFEAEAKRHPKAPQYHNLVTPAGTPYRLLKRSEERT